MLNSLWIYLNPITLTGSVKRRFNRNMMLYGVASMMEVILFVIYEVPGIVFNGPSPARSAVGWSILIGLAVLAMAHPIIRYQAFRQQIKLDSERNFAKALKNE